MSSLRQIKQALADTIEAAVTAEELNVYTYIPDLIQTPAVCIDPHNSDFTGAMARGDDMWRFNVYVVVQRTDAEESQDFLDGLLDSDGPSSVRGAIFAKPDLGLSDCQAFVTSMHEYGGGYRDARIDVIGAVLRVDVHTDGRNL
jgi:hypothetical protein